MFRALLAKDLRRAWRNPLPWLTNLALPLCITALIGLAFGGRSDSGALGRIRFAVVDEDNSPLTSLLRGAANQQEAAQHLEPVFLDRATALRQVADDKLSAALIIPTNFTRHYLTGREPVTLELVKNPAQSLHPAVLEELLGAVTTALNALARNFQSEFPEWQKVFEGKGDFHQVAMLIERAGDKVQSARKFLLPPLVSYERAVKAGESKSGPAFNLFAFLLAGLVGMFLLFLASNAMSDLQREAQSHTLARYHTLHQRLLPFVGGKVLFAFVFLLLCSAVMLGGGALIFHIQWQQPFALAVLVAAYALFAAGLMAALTALMPDLRRANVLNNLAGMALGLAGGCAFPPQQLPAFVREHLTPQLPSFWFADAVRGLNQGVAGVPWAMTSLKLAGLALVLIVLAALIFRRRFESGARA